MGRISSVKRAFRKPRVRISADSVRKRRKYIVQRVEEKNGKEELIDLYEEYRRPFDLYHRDSISNELLRRYGPGRYVIKSVDRRTGKEILHYSGEASHPSRGKVWTRKERFAYTQVRRSGRRVKTAALAYYIAIFLALSGLFFYSLINMNAGLLTASVVAMVAFILFAIVIMQGIFYETE